MIELLLFMALSVKHFIIDFPLQGPYQWKNKGTYLHQGGIYHAMLHLTGTIIAIASVFAFTGQLNHSTIKIIPLMGLLDGFIHYHIDWAKMNINQRMGWLPNTHPEFWWLLGFDQLLHTLTYVLIIAIIV